MSTPTLPDDRIDAMRSHVMSTVTHDVRQRGRRTRRRLGAVAASVIVVGVGAYGVGTLETSSVSTSNDSAAKAEYNPAEVQSDNQASGDSGGKAELQEQAPSDAPAQTGRQVITTGSISVTVDRPRESAGKLSAYVESIGGRIDSRSEDGRGTDASASLQIRVPATKVSATIKQLGTYGTVDNVSLQNEDVTSVSKDLDARIDALQISVDRLQGILAAADTSKDVITAERALTERQEQLESLQSQKRSLASQVDLSTIGVDFSQTASVDSVEPGGFTGGLRDGWNGLVSTVNHVVEIAGVLLPWLAVAAVLAAIVKIWRLRRGSRRSRRGAAG